jgi:hypothetical protein
MADVPLLPFAPEVCPEVSPLGSKTSPRQPLSLRQPPPQRLEEALIPFPPLSLRRGLRAFRQGWRGGEPGADVERERFDRPLTLKHRFSTAPRFPAP